MRLLILFISFLISQIADSQIISASPPYRVRASGCSYLLDQYSGAAAAYSLRQLDCQYAGALIRVRRSSDNTEEDFYPDASGNLDTAALKTFVGTGGTDDGFVVTWYTQVGSDNMVQTTAGNQPLIMDNGVVYREDGLPAISFVNASSTYLITTFSLAQAFTIFSACKIPTAATTSNWYHILDGLATGGGNSSPTITYNSGIAQKTLMYAGTVLGDATVRSGYALTSALFNGASSVFYYNNTSILSGNANTLGFQNVKIGANWDISIYNNVKYWELIIYGSDQSSNISGINSNINSYYTIY